MRAVQVSPENQLQREPSGTQCPRCSWTCGEPTRRRNPLDLLMLWIRMQHFRCRSCGKCFYSFSFQRA